MCICSLFVKPRKMTALSSVFLSRLCGLSLRKSPTYRLRSSYRTSWLKPLEPICERQKIQKVRQNIQGRQKKSRRFGEFQKPEKMGISCTHTRGKRKSTKVPHWTLILFTLCFSIKAIFVSNFSLSQRGLTQDFKMKGIAHISFLPTNEMSE